MPILAADLTWLEGAFQHGVAVQYSELSGRIERIGPLHEVTGGRIERLPHHGLLPGFVNVHSHAFQRLLRGCAQWRPATGGPSDFWTWRDAMYRVALRLSPDDLYDAARFCFIEMLRAGYTTVGEFHYLHRDPAGHSYDDRGELAARVIAAAEDAGIRIRLLNVAYASGGIRRPLQREQRRFATPDLDVYLRDCVELFERAAGRPLVSVGVAPHSVRAVPQDWLGPIHSLAYGWDAPIHVHAAEQPDEVSACLAAYGRRPIELLADAGLLDEHLTVVHATHINHREVELLALPGPTVCACPGTERDLGDGMLPAAELVGAGARIALGSDSNTIIAPLEEMRLVEYHERLRKLRRAVLARKGDQTDRFEVAPVLLDMATRTGADALRLETGVIEPARYADFIAVDLDHRSLEGWTTTSLPAMLALCAGADVVSDVWVGGRRRVRDRAHPAEAEAGVAFRAVATAVKEG